MIDVDHFKRINDEYGHPMGDLVLQQLATILDQNVRAADLAARYGGEEYAAVLAETPKFGALALAKQLRRLVAEHSFGIGDEAGPNRVTISIGIATFPEDADDADELILIADQRLYQAKETGRDRVVA
jgi:diguanylate cyclase (GGDEF)-like protein